MNHEYEQLSFAAVRGETRGKAAIDSGATRSTGSRMAIRDVEELGFANHGSDGVVNFDREDADTLRFGNGSSQIAAGRAGLRTTAAGQEGAISTQAVPTDDKYVPRLASID